MSAMKLSELSKALLLAIDEAPQSPRLARCSMLAAALHAKIRQMAVQESAGEPVAWMYDKGDEQGLVTAFNPLTTPGHSGRQNIRPLYTCCRFQNTLVDFRECVAAIEADEDLSDVETDAALDLVTLAAKLVRLMTPKYYGPDLRDVAIAALWSARGTLEEIARPKVVANNVGSLMQEILSDTAKAQGAIDAIDRAMAELHRDTR